MLTSQKGPLAISLTARKPDTKLLLQKLLFFKDQPENIVHFITAEDTVMVTLEG